MTDPAPFPSQTAAERRPRCAFCDAPWTDVMLDWFGPDTGGCSCCDGAILGHWPLAAAAPRPLPTEDLACHACGKVLYQAPRPRSGG